MISNGLSPYFKYINLISFFIAAVIALSAQQASSSERMSHETNELLEIALDLGSLKSFESRVNLISRISNFCKAIKTAAPINTPREEDWLEKELNAGDGVRMSRALSSSEYSRDQLNKFSSHCIERTSVFLNYHTKWPYDEKAKHFLVILDVFVGFPDINEHAKIIFGQDKAIFLGFYTLKFIITALVTAGLWTLQEK